MQQPEYFIESLQSLRCSLEEMQTLSLFIRTNKRDYELIHEIYVREFEKSNDNHRLTLLYLCNEIIQTEQAKDEYGLKLLSNFRKVAPVFLKKALETENPQIKQKLINLGNIWVQRNIFDHETIFGKAEEIKRIKTSFENKSESLPQFTNNERKSSLDLNKNYSDVSDVNKFSKNEVLRRINSYFDEKNKLILYLKEFIDKIEDKRN